MGFLSRKNEAESKSKHTKELTIVNRLGLHARPSAMFVKMTMFLGFVGLTAIASSDSLP